MTGKIADGSRCQFLISLSVAVAIALIYIPGVVESAAKPWNERPVIGILAQAVDEDLRKYGNEYIISSYVKYLEMAGASVVGVKGNQTLTYYRELFKKINGVLFPGGHVDIMKSPISRSAHIIYKLAKEANDRGEYFPLWGTCQGFQHLTVITAGRNVLTESDSENMSIPLTLTESYNKSRLLGQAPVGIIDYLTTENVTANFHHSCLSTKTYKNEASLNKFFHVLSVNRGRKGKEFVSTMEAFNYPFYGTQWHPEKNLFTGRIDQAVSRTAHAVKISQYFADFFVNESRKSLHGFPTEQERSTTVIENDVRIYIPKDYVENFFYNVTKI